MIYEAVTKECALAIENDPRGRGVVLIITPAPGRVLEPRGHAAILSREDVVRVAVELLAKAGKEITLEVLEALKLKKTDPPA